MARGSQTTRPERRRTAGQPSPRCGSGTGQNTHTERRPSLRARPHRSAPRASWTREFSVEATDRPLRLLGRATSPASSPSHRKSSPRWTATSTPRSSGRGATPPPTPSSFAASAAPTCRSTCRPWTASSPAGTAGPGSSPPGSLAHALRHTYATLLVDAGASLPEVLPPEPPRPNSARRSALWSLLARQLRRRRRDPRLDRESGARQLTRDIVSCHGRHCSRSACDRRSLPRGAGPSRHDMDHAGRRPRSGQGTVGSTVGTPCAAAG